MLEEVAACSVLTVDVLVEEASRGVTPVALAALEPLAHMILHVIEERFRREFCSSKLREGFLFHDFHN